MAVQRKMILGRQGTLAALVLGTALGLHAQAEEDPCRKAARELDTTVNVADCIDLATYILGMRTDKFYLSDEAAGLSADDSIVPRDLQSSSPHGAATSGTEAQGEAVPSVQPLALAGGSVAAAGSDAGANTITALTLNPSLFFLGPEDKEAIAKLSRFTDVTLLVPVDEVDRNEDGDVDYFGARIRMNLNSFSQGNAILEEARGFFKAIIANEAYQQRLIASALEAATDKKKCAAAFLAGGEGVRQACDGHGDIVLDEGQYTEFRRRLRTARERADAFYWGLDLRYDHGDPTLGEVPGADGKSLFAGVAYGKRYLDRSLSSLGLRFLAGIRYKDQNDYVDTVKGRVKGETDYALEGGLGLDLAKTYLQQTIRLSLGAEFRASDPPDGEDEEFQTNYLLLRASLNVPVSASTSLSVNFGYPAIGDISPSLSINGNWSLLLPDVN